MTSKLVTTVHHEYGTERHCRTHATLDVELFVERQDDRENAAQSGLRIVRIRAYSLASRAPCAANEAFVTAAALARVASA